jgi:hypothetical protein
VVTTEELKGRPSLDLRYNIKQISGSANVQ